jgi:M6 family metalloprotease-like protein
MAISADPDARVTLEQPDGSIFTARPVGDEHNGRLVTLHGYTIFLDESGWYYYAESGPDGRLRPTGIRVSGTDDLSTTEQAALDVIPRNLSGSGIVPSLEQRVSSADITGTWNTLILLIQYPDDPGDYAPYQFENLANEHDYTETGSIRDYFTEASDTILTIDGTAMGWFTASRNHDYYSFSNYEVPNAIGLLVKEVLVAAEAMGLDFSPYDNDGDGEVDGLFVVHAGPGAEQGYSDYPWSHWSKLSYWEIMPLFADGVMVNGYTIVPELQVSDTLFNMVTIGVFCHELSHMFGVTDLYVSSGASRAGGWCLMTGGAWFGPPGRSGAVPAMMNAWCRSEVGWIDPIRLSEDLPGAMVSHLLADNNAYRLWDQGATGPEYFLVEYRRQLGFDQYQPGSGMAIWHVDERYGNNSHTHPGVCVLEAMDGLPGYDATDLWLDSTFNGETVPSNYSNADLPTNVSVHVISQDTQEDFLLADLAIGLTPCVAGVDSDGDGIEDCDDNCRAYPNSDQADVDGHLLGDACDDWDADGWANYEDNCDTIPNVEQQDWDEDGIGDLCDDSDDDGFLDAYDNCVATYNPDQDDWDENGTGDVCDDYDGDGVVDSEDNCVEIYNPDQSDWNDNNIGDECDACCGRYTLGYAGNANCSDDGKITLSDISALIDRVYISRSQLCCEENGNVEGDTEGKITLSDISRLIDHVFISKLPTAGCL